MRPTSCFFVLLVCFIGGQIQAISAQDPPTPPEPKAFLSDNQASKTIELSQMLERLPNYEVIFLGENHENDSGHLFQLEVIRGLHAAGRSLVISTEQFERDVQGALDDYLAGRISEEQFLAASRPWKNYPAHYRPIIEFAKEQKLPVIAGNIPRPLASRISNGESLKPHEQMFAARQTSAPEDRYWHNFLDSMKGHMGADGSEQMRKFYQAQCAKDDAMAEAITDFLAKNRHRQQIVVHLCGYFHSDYGLGTAARVVQREPLLRTAIVTMELFPEKGQPDLKSQRDRAHFTYWIVPNSPPPESNPANPEVKKSNP